MKKIIIFLFAAIIFGFFVFPVYSKEYLWICPVVSFDEKSANGMTSIHWAGNHIFQINVDGGKLSEQFLADLKNCRGYILIDDAEIDNDSRGQALTFRKIIIIGSKMTIQSADGKKTTIEPTSDFLRRALYPVEPTEDNEWSGWPMKK